MNKIAGPVNEFRDDDDGYMAWLAAHPVGYVINIARSHSASTARVHHAGCRTISGTNPRGGTWTGPYIKVCSEHRDELEQWAMKHARAQIPLCGTCHPARDAAKPTSLKQTMTPQSPEARWDVHGPTTDSPVVEAWSDSYIRFEHLPPWQQHLRNEIRSRCRQLAPSAGQVLHATFFGPKLPNADVENLALYNIDPSFRVPGRHGIRFEHGAAVPPAPDGVEYLFGYRYALAPHSDTFAHWQKGRTIASFDWTDLGDFVGEKKLAQVWLALARAYDRGQFDVAEPAVPETPFAVRVQVRPPYGHEPVWGGLVKSIFDGVISAFQAHTDTTVLSHVVGQLAKVLPAEPVEIEKHLLDQRRAALGVVQRLVKPFGAGVQWMPADHWCVAGELLSAEPIGPRWAITGEVIELSR